MVSKTTGGIWESTLTIASRPTVTRSPADDDFWTPSAADWDLSTWSPERLQRAHDADLADTYLSANRWTPDEQAHGEQLAVAYVAMCGGDPFVEVDSVTTLDDIRVDRPVAFTDLAGTERIERHCTSKSASFGHLGRIVPSSGSGRRRPPARLRPSWRTGHGRNTSSWTSAHQLGGT